MKKYELYYNLLLYGIIFGILITPLLLFLLAVIFIKFNIYNTVGSLLFLISSISIFTLAFKINKLKGPIGEAITRLIIYKFANESSYINMHNLLLRNSKTGYSQIDHIVITTKGIAVIETKYHLNYKIYGDEHDKTWTYKNIKGYTHQRNNPLRQNYGHIQALKELINDDTISYYNIVAYIDVSKIEKCTLTNKNSRCIYTYDLPKTIKELVDNDHTPKIGIAKMSEIVCKIREAEIKDKNIKRDYFKKLKQKYN